MESQVNMKKERVLRMRKRKVEEEGSPRANKKKVDASGEEEASRTSKQKPDLVPGGDNVKPTDGTDEDDQLEDFEIGASEHVTKQDAMKLYCLPNGTIAVCKCIEKPNPRNALWQPMKLYLRSEIRRRARDRFGGRQGLINERKRREVKKLEKEMDSAKDFFS